MYPLRFVYSFLLTLSWFVLKIVALFSSKIKLFVSGRKKTFADLRNKIHPDAKSIWMHVASLGEYEQGLPILEQLKSIYPDYKFVLTFFSPSGYEVKKNAAVADAIVYLPMDTMGNAKKFLDMVRPELAVFIKYEIWPNYLYELSKRKIPTVLASAIFSKRQVFFSPFGGFMRKSLRAFSHFFVQEDHSKTLLSSIGFENVTVSGDTRFDRVREILERDNRLDFMDNFKGDNFCIVAGSTWPEDEKILIEFINTSKEDLKFVLAPHEVKKNHVDAIIEQLLKKTVRYSEITTNNISNFQVLVVDTIGLLTKIYSYANLAYVGGGFATGLHNTLEPAAFGIPVVVGPKYHGFKEAEDLVAKGGIISIGNQQGFDSTMNKMITDETFLKECGMVNSNYLEKNVGATDIIVTHIRKIL